MINRNVTRTILNSVETTLKTKTPGAPALAFELTASEFLYLGFKAPFTTRYFHLSTPNETACTLTVEYWNGSSWVEVDDLIDQTLGFTQSGFISWANGQNWTAREIAPLEAAEENSEIDLYWVRIKTSADLSEDTELQCVLNLFCDDNLARTLYPDIFTSTYYPTGRTDFLEQYVAAKDLVTLRLKQKGEIDDESQILDVTEVATAAVHAVVYILFVPIARDDTKRAVRDDAEKAMNKEISKTTITVDRNSSGSLEKSEVQSGGTTWVTR